MKNIFHLGSKEPNKKEIKKVTVVSILIYILCIICLSTLYLIDTAPVSIEVLTEFLDNEEEYLYNIEYNAVPVLSDRKYIHSISARYIASTIEVQFAELSDVIAESDRELYKKVSSLDEAIELVNNLIPENIQYANNWTRMFVNRFAYYDMLSALDTDCEEYWEMSSYAWQHIVLHSHYKNVNFLSFLYDNMANIVACYVLVMLYTFCFDLLYLVIYLIQVHKMKGVNNNDVHREA